MNRIKNGFRYCSFCYRTSLQESFYLHSKSMGDKHVSLMHAILQYSIMMVSLILKEWHISQIMQIFSDKCCKDTKDNAPGSSKSNKRNDKRFNNRGYPLFFLMGIFLKHL